MRVVRFVQTMLLLAVMLALASATAADVPREDCFSCRIQINSLDHPVSLVGKWLFTRDDNPQNKEINADTSRWVLAKAPGPWKKLYDDNRVYSVGWYRGTLEFAPSLIGQEVVLLLNTYMARTVVYVDGKEIYRRPHNINVERYYATQAIPVRFTITKPSHVVAMRVDTPLMVGVYQLPFELRTYDQNDFTLVAYQLIGGELRQVIGFVVFFFGLFFLLVYWKTRHALYLVSSLISILVSIFFVAPGDVFMRHFSPESMVYLQFPGIAGIYMFYGLSQFFHRFSPRANWAIGIAASAMGLTLALTPIHQNLELFQQVRSIFFAMVVPMSMLIIYNFYRGVQAKKPGALILLVGQTVCLLTVCNDAFLALGLITSMSVIHLGIMVAVVSMLYVSSNMFANTFLHNRRLAKDLKVMNDNLEEIVKERTAQLRQKTADVQAMLQNMPQGVMTVLPSSMIHPEYSAYLETIFETREIVGKSLMELVFSRTDLGADVLDQFVAAVESIIGEDRMNFDFNVHLLISELNLTMPDGRVKSLEFSWSPICDDHETVEKLMLCVRDVTEIKRLAGEASAQRRELDIIGEILAVTQERFQEFLETASRFVRDNEATIRLTPRKDLDVINLLFRNMHTIKGNARTYGLNNMTNIVHETEQVYDNLRKFPEQEWHPESLLAQLEQVRAAIEEYRQINDVTLGRKGPGRRGNVERFLMVERQQVSQFLTLIDSVPRSDNTAMNAALDEIHKTLNLLGTEKIETILSGIIESLPSLAQELGKEVPKVIIEDHGIVVRNQVFGTLKNVFTHQLRNSIDHGLEKAEARVAAGKSPAGQIRISASLADGMLKLRISDDGRGMAIARIRQIALAKNLLTPEEAVVAYNVAQLVFVAGFSTADKVTEVSGRGVGMDAVKAFIEEVGGSVRFNLLDDSEADFRPIELLISLPGKFAVQT